MNAQLWNDMFVLALPVLEKIIRPIIVYFALTIGLRLAGKRELAQLNPFDLVVLLTISNTVQNAIIGNDNSVTGGIIGMATLLLINYLVVRFTYENKAAEAVLEGTEDIVIDHGVVQKKVLDRELLSLSEVEIAAHKQGFNDISEVDRAVLEPGGGIAFIRKVPEPEQRRHIEEMQRLDALMAEMTALRADLNRIQGSASNPSIQ